MAEATSKRKFVTDSDSPVTGLAHMEDEVAPTTKKSNDNISPQYEKASSQDCETATLIVSKGLVGPIKEFLQILSQRFVVGETPEELISDLTSNIPALQSQDRSQSSLDNLIQQSWDLSDSVNGNLQSILSSYSQNQLVEDVPPEFFPLFKEYRSLLSTWYRLAQNAKKRFGSQYGEAQGIISVETHISPTVNDPEWRKQAYATITAAAKSVDMQLQIKLCHKLQDLNKSISDKLTCITSESEKRIWAKAYRTVRNTYRAAQARHNGNSSTYSEPHRPTPRRERPLPRRRDSVQNLEDSYRAFKRRFERRRQVSFGTSTTNDTTTTASEDPTPGTSHDDSAPSHPQVSYPSILKQAFGSSDTTQVKRAHARPKHTYPDVEPSDLESSSDSEPYLRRSKNTRSYHSKNKYKQTPHSHWRDYGPRHC